eukprot:scaffold49326_cov45-Prasinocladus_malaysianus.AAC.1
MELWQTIRKLQEDVDSTDGHLRAMMSRYRSPTRAEQTWILRVVRDSALLFGGLYITAHSSLNGSSDLEKWFQSLSQSVKAFFSEHLIQPMQQIKNELQRTFAANDEVDVKALQESRNILQRMLQDFDQRHTSSLQGSQHGPGGAMERVLAKYEAEAKSPITNLVTGDLSNLMMIQMQSIKVQMESALLQMDRILQANQINFAAMTSMPFFGAIYGAGVLLRRLSDGRQTSQAALKKQKRYARMLLVEVERAILTCQDKKSVRPHELGQQIFCLNA